MEPAGRPRSARPRPSSPGDGSGRRCSRASGSPACSSRRPAGRSASGAGPGTASSTPHEQLERRHLGHGAGRGLDLVRPADDGRRSRARPPEPLAVHPLAAPRHERAARLRVAARARLHRRPRPGGRGRPVHPFRPLGRARAVREPLPPRLDGPRHRRALPAPRRVGQLASASPDRPPPLAADPRARLRRLRGGDAARPRHRKRHEDDLGRRALRGERRPRRLASRRQASGAGGARRAAPPARGGRSGRGRPGGRRLVARRPVRAGLVRRAREGRRPTPPCLTAGARRAQRPPGDPPTAVVHVPFTARYAGRLTVEP